MGLRGAVDAAGEPHRIARDLGRVVMHPPIRAVPTGRPLEPVEGLFELRARALAPQLAEVLTSTDRDLLVPVIQALDFLGIPYRFAGQQLFVARPLGQGENVLDLARGEVRTPEISRSLTRLDLVEREGIHYLGWEALALLIEGDISPDWSELFIEFERPGGEFPAQTRARILAERERALRMREPTDQGPAVAVPYRSRSGGAVVEWGLTAAGSVPTSLTGGTARVGLGLLGGELSTGATWAAAGSGGWAGQLTNFHRVFPDGRLLREIRVGDVSTPGLHREAIRGVVLTNVPRLREEMHDVLPVLPDLPPGWEYEVYRGSELVGHSDASALEPVGVPLRQGTTPIRVRLLGPAGEEVVTEYHYQVPRDLLRAGRAEYVLAGGTCRALGCDRLGWAEARYGVASTLTVGGGARYSADSVSTRLRPTATGLWLPAPGWMGEVEYTPGAVRQVGIRYQHPDRFSGSVAAGSRAPRFQPPSPTDTQDRERWFVHGGVGGRTTSPLFRSVRFAGLAEGDGGAGPDRLRFSTYGSVRHAFVELRYERAPYLDRDVVSLRSSTSRIGPLRRYGGRGSAAVDFDEDGLRGITAGVGFSPTGASRIDLRTRWRAGSTPAIALGYSTVLPAIRVRARSSAGQAGGVHSTVSLGGALALDRETGVHAFSRQGMHTAGVKGRVFYDHSGDGVFGPGDELAEGIPVRVGALRAQTDSEGTYRSWAMQPYEVLQVRIDTLAIRDPSWTPLMPEVLVRPTPHMFNRVDIPLVRTRELFGQLEAGAGVRTVGGVTLEIEEATTGERRSFTTFQDGSFYLSRVRPGTYRLRVSERSLEVLRAVARPETLEFVIPATGDDPLVEVPAVQIVRIADAL